MNKARKMISYKIDEQGSLNATHHHVEIEGFSGYKFLIVFFLGIVCTLLLNVGVSIQGDISGQEYDKTKGIIGWIIVGGLIVILLVLYFATLIKRHKIKELALEKGLTKITAEEYEQLEQELKKSKKGGF